MNLKKAFSELGKQFLNVGVAGVVFAFLQPFVQKTLSLETALFSVIWYITFTLVGFLLISLSEEKNGGNS